MVRSTAMSERLSFTSMISDDTTLNAATRTIMPSTMNMVSFCTCKHADDGVVGVPPVARIDRPPLYQRRQLPSHRADLIGVVQPDLQIR